MMVLNKLSFKALLVSAALSCAFGGTASAAEVAGVKFADTVKVAGKELQLNGFGVRTKFVVKVYAHGLYLTEKKTTTEEVMKLDGPRRAQLVMMRDTSSDDFGEAFMAGIGANSTAAEKSKIITQISKFGEMFALLPGLKKGDVLDLDWIPGSGTTCYLNGKRIGEIAEGIEFHNAILKIWLGDKPVDSSLKPRLLNGGVKK